MKELWAWLGKKTLQLKSTESKGGECQRTQSEFFPTTNSNSHFSTKISIYPPHISRAGLLI